MSIYCEHVEPRETPEEFIARIEHEKRAQRAPFTPPPTRPAVPIKGLAMAPGKPVFV